MPYGRKRGNILIPLIIILAISLIVLVLSKYFGESQANIETAIDSRYQTSLSSKMDPVVKWVKYTNPDYKYSMNYPKQWVGNLTTENKNGTQHTYERFLSNKINLKVTILRNYQIPEKAKPAKFDENEFYFTADEEELKTAVATYNNRYYQIDLKQSAYFNSSEEFRGTFFQILKKFQLPQSK